MGRKAAALVLLAVLGLLSLGVGLSWRLLSAVEQAARLASTDRLQAMGLAAARALERGADLRLLDALRRDGQLEDAYLLDGALRPIGRDGGAPTLLRVDPDRALAALTGPPSVGPAYDLEAPEADGGAPPQVLAGYFAVGQGRVLVLEAGAAFVAAPRRVRTAAWTATAASAALLPLVALSVLLGVRAAARERVLHGQAERGSALSQMAAMVAHEVRNPLGTIRAGAELLLEQRAAAEIAGDIVAEVDRLNRLIGEFLTLSREPPIDPRPFDLAALCDEVCVQLRRRFAGSALCVERPGEGQLEIIGDADRLRQVLLNLGLNAVQAMESRGRRELHLSRRRGGARVVVSDDGPGVDAPLSRRLFEPFVTSKPDGTGLGLVTSRRIAERHGGSLELLAPEPGQRGARFALDLPRRPPAAP